MVNITLDQNELRRLVEEKLTEALREADVEHVFWDTDELKRRTCMCWNTILSTFFYDPRFPKAKIGGKWYFPARQAREFLERWFEEQRKNSA